MRVSWALLQASVLGEWRTFAVSSFFIFFAGAPVGFGLPALSRLNPGMSSAALLRERDERDIDRVLHARGVTADSRALVRLSELVDFPLGGFSFLTPPESDSNSIPRGACHVYSTISPITWIAVVPFMGRVYGPSWSALPPLRRDDSPSSQMYTSRGY
jgi:hypothetical protein